MTVRTLMGVLRTHPKPGLMSQAEFDKIADQTIDQIEQLETQGVRWWEEIYGDFDPERNQFLKFGITFFPSGTDFLSDKVYVTLKSLWSTGAIMRRRESLASASKLPIAA